MSFRAFLLSRAALTYLVTVAVQLHCLAAEAVISAAVQSEQLTFEQHVRPILKTHCFQCHGEDGHLEGKLDLRLRRLILAGGDSGPGMVPGQASDSLVFKRIHSGEMPPNGKAIPSNDADVIERWIAAGAITARDEPSDVSLVGEITAEEKAYWAFQPVLRPPVPDVAHPAGSVQPANAALSPIDAVSAPLAQTKRPRFKRRAANHRPKPS